MRRRETRTNRNILRKALTTRERAFQQSMLNERYYRSTPHLQCLNRTIRTSDRDYVDTLLQFRQALTAEAVDCDIGGAAVHISDVCREVLTLDAVDLQFTGRSRHGTDALTETF